MISTYTSIYEFDRWYLYPVNFSYLLINASDVLLGCSFVALCLHSLGNCHHWLLFEPMLLFSRRHIGKGRLLKPYIFWARQETKDVFVHKKLRPYKRRKMVGAIRTIVCMHNPILFILLNMGFCSSNLSR